MIKREVLKIGTQMKLHATRGARATSCSKSESLAANVFEENSGCWLKVVRILKNDKKLRR